MSAPLPASLGGRPRRPAHAGWWHDAGQRFRTRCVAKGAATTLGISGFFVAYFWVLHHPLSTPTVMPLTVLDGLIGFQAGALPLYFSLWFYVCIPPALLANGRELASYALACLVMSITGLTLFVLWPTAVPVPAIDWTQHPSIAFLKDVDLAANACPSMHVAFAVFAAIWLERLLCEMRSHAAVRALNALWCLGILYSTIATRQHVVLDVLAGALLAAVVAALQLRSLRGDRAEAAAEYPVS